MNTVDILPKTTFNGRQFTRKQLAQVQEIVQLFLNLSRKELARTVCEHLRWTTPIGQYKVTSCMTLLINELEAHGIVPLPAKQVEQAPGQPIPAFQKPPATPPLTDTLTAVAPITTGDIKGGARVLDSLSPTYHLCGRTFNLSVQPQELVSRAAAVGSAPSLSVSQSKAHS